MECFILLKVFTYIHNPTKSLKHVSGWIDVTFTSEIHRAPRYQAELIGRCMESPWFLGPGNKCGPTLPQIKSGFLSNPHNNCMMLGCKVLGDLTI